MNGETIVAQSTAAGRGALAIVRLTGPEAISIAARVFRPRSRLLNLVTRSCAVGRLVDGDESIDQVVAILFRAPDTYTGEDLIELTCHGGHVVPTRITELLVRAGARLAQPGEFTLRAFLHGRIDLSQAEAVAALINARSAAAARAAMHVLDGGLRRALEPCLDRLAEALAALEANLDIQEDGAPDVLAPASDAHIVTEILEAEQRRLGALLAGVRGARLLEEGIRVAIVGPPNAGKSSLFNALLSRERALVSREAGTTRDFLEAWVEWSTLPIVLIDTAGLRCGGDAVESEAIRRTREAAASANIIVWVVDVSVTDPDAAERDVRAMAWTDQRIVQALHKWDLGAPHEWCVYLDRLAVAPRVRPAAIAAPPRAVPSSACAPPGVDALRLAVVAHAQQLAGGIESATAIGERQRVLLADAEAALSRARALVSDGSGAELIAFEIREAMRCLGAILGQRVDTRVLEEIFSRFCVGK